MRRSLRARAFPRIGQLLLSFLLMAAALSALPGCARSDPAALLAQVQQALDDDQTDAALVTLRMVLDKQPESGAARWLLARTLLAKGDLAGAEIELRRAEAFGHAAADIAETDATLLLAQGQAARVRERYTQVIAGSPEAEAGLLVQRAAALRQLGAPEEAQTVVTQALQRRPGHVPASVLQARLAVERGDRGSAKRMASELLARSPGSGPAWLLQGDLHTLEGDVSAASAAYRKALELRPRWDDAHLSLITSVLRQGDSQAAGGLVEQMAKVLPAHPMTSYFRALMAYGKGDYARSNELLQGLMRRTGEHPKTVFLAGMVQFRTGNFVQAETLLAKAMMLSPEAVEPRREMASLHARKGRPDRALETLEPLLARNIADAATWRVAGEAQARKGDFAAADRAFATADRLKPDNPQTLTEVGKSLVARGQLEPGLQALERAAGAEPTGISAELALLATHMQRKDRAAALRTLDAIQRKQPESAFPEFLRGQVLQRIEGSVAARAAYERALTRDATYMPAINSLAELDVASQDYAGARRRYEAVVKGNHRAAPAMLALAELVRRSGGAPAEAVGWLDKAVGADPRDASMWLAAIDHHRRMSDPPAMLARARAAAAALPEHADIQIELGAAYLAVGDVQAATAALAHVVKLRPQSADAHLRHAQALIVNKRLPPAREALTKALALAPDWAPALRTLVGLDMQEGQAVVALKRARELQARRPELALGWQLEGQIELERQNSAAALLAWRKALAKEENTDNAVEVHRLMATAAPTGEAAQFEKRWTSQHPRDLMFRMHLAQTASASGGSRAAEAQYRQVLALSPEDPAALNNLAYLLAQRKDPEALALAERAHRLAPSMPTILDTLSRAHESAGNLKKAVDYQSQAVELLPQAGKYRLRLARLHLLAGSKAKARDELTRLERLGPQAVPPAELQELTRQAGPPPRPGQVE